MMHLLTGAGKHTLGLMNEESCGDDAAALCRGAGEDTSKGPSESRVGVQKWVF